VEKVGPGDALYDLASLTFGHPEHLGDVIAGYGTDVDLDAIRARWSLRSLLAIRWLPGRLPPQITRKILYSKS
jgi:hypothetical protein